MQLFKFYLKYPLTFLSIYVKIINIILRKAVKSNDIKKY